MKKTEEKKKTTRKDDIYFCECETVVCGESVEEVEKESQKEVFKSLSGDL